MTVLLRLLVVADCITFGFVVDHMARNHRARQEAPLAALRRCVIRSREFH